MVLYIRWLVKVQQCQCFQLWSLLLYLVQVLQFGRQVVSNHLHGFEWRLVEVRRLPIHHLYDHDPQRPDVHLDTARRESQQVEEMCLFRCSNNSGIMRVGVLPLVHKAVWILALVPSSTVFQPETSFFALP